MNLTKLLSSDRAILGICILLATVIWFISKLGERITFTSNTQLVYNLPTGYSLASPAPEEMDLTLSGDGWSLWRFFRRNETNHFAIQILPNEGTQVISPENLQQNFKRNFKKTDVNLLMASPSNLVLQIEKSSERCLPLKVPLDLKYMKSFAHTRPIQFSHDSVCIYGAPSVLSSYNKWVSDSLSLKNIDKDTKGSIQLQPPPGISIEPVEIEYHLEVAQFTNFSTEINLETRPMASDSIVLLPNHIVVSCQVPLQKYEQVADYFQEAYVSIDSARNILPVKLSTDSLPSWIRNLRIEPSQIEYFIKE